MKLKQSITTKNTTNNSNSGKEIIYSQVKRNEDYINFFANFEIKVIPQQAPKEESRTNGTN